MIEHLWARRPSGGPSAKGDWMVKKRIELVGVTEIAELLGVSRQRVLKLHADRKEHSHPFPEALEQLRGGLVFDRRDVVEWDKQRRRLAKKKKEKPPTQEVRSSKGRSSRGGRSAV
jgi:hypothetical protein